MRHTFAGVALALAVTLAAPAKDEWKKKPPAQWTQEEAIEFLTKSPWAKEVDVWHLTGRQVRETVQQRTQTYSDAPGEAPVTMSTSVSNVAPEQVAARYRVVWTSAEIVRKGWERLKQLDAAVAELYEPPESSAAHHVVTVRVVTPPVGTPVIFAGLTTEELRSHATLRTSAKTRLEAEQVVVHGAGAAMAVSFYFPRQFEGRPALPPGVDSAEFEFESPAGDKLKHKFRLKEMRMGGRADY